MKPGISLWTSKGRRRSRKLLSSPDSGRGHRLPGRQPRPLQPADRHSAADQRQTRTFALAWDAKPRTANTDTANFFLFHASFSQRVAARDAAAVVPCVALSSKQPRISALSIATGAARHATLFGPSPSGFWPPPRRRKTPKRCLPRGSQLENTVR
jgi:hypothetical protein